MPATLVFPMDCPGGDATVKYTNDVQGHCVQTCTAHSEIFEFNDSMLFDSFSPPQALTVFGSISRVGSGPIHPILLQ